MNAIYAHVGWESMKNRQRKPRYPNMKILNSIINIEGPIDGPHVQIGILPFL